MSAYFRPRQRKLNFFFFFKLNILSIHQNVHKKQQPSEFQE